MQHPLSYVLSIALLIAILLSGCDYKATNSQNDQELSGSDSTDESKEEAKDDLKTIQDQITEIARSLEKVARTKTEEVRPVMDEMSSKAINDLKALSQWEYMTEKLDISSASPQVRLNTLGKDGWELVTVVESNGEHHFIYKRRPASVFRNIPARDLLRLLTLLQ